MLNSSMQVKRLLPWQDRWAEPSIEQLIEPLAPHHLKPVTSFLDLVIQYDAVDKSVVWFGPGWQWTIQYAVNDPEGQLIEPLCYVIPNYEVPLLCVPVTDRTYDRLPIRRLPKLIRTGLRSAKRAVNTHWAVWNLTVSSELEQFMELLKRKHKYLREPFKASTSKSSRN